MNPILKQIAGLVTVGLLTASCTPKQQNPDKTDTNPKADSVGIASVKILTDFIQ